MPPHRSLELGNISRLPENYRQLANTAVHGTLRDLQDFVDLCGQNRAFSRPTLFLPVFFAILDPATIPSFQQIDSSPPGTLDPLLRRVILSMKALVSGRKAFGLPEEASVDIWQRAWKWMSFMDTYKDSLPAASAKSTYAVYMSTILDLQSHGGTKAMIDATPGLRVVVTRAWATFLRFPDCISEPGFHDVCRFIVHDLKASQPRILQEVIEGSGGSVSDLAVMLIKHLHLVVLSGQPPSEMPRLFLAGVIGVLDDADRDVSLKNALLSAGIVKAVMTVVSYSEGTTTPNMLGVLNDCFTLLSRIFTSFPAAMCIPDALRSGILRIVCQCAIAHSTHAGLRAHMQSLLCEVLPPAMVYHSVLKCMEDALRDAQKQSEDVRFKRSAQWEDWNKLVRLAEARVKVAVAYDWGQYPSERGCENPVCTKIIEKRDLKRCAACRRLIYCSDECQRSHWRVGGHRAQCARLRASRISKPEQLTTRDRSFMRALTHHDYNMNMANVLLAIVQLNYELPNEPYYLLYDYTAGDVTIEVLPISEVEVPPTPSDFQVQWLDHIARAARSDGRMEVAIIRYVQDSRACFQMVSSHSEDSAVPDHLRHLAHTIPRGRDWATVQPAMLRKIRALIGQ
ncbi:hypothetical protein B0H15DRAFT_345770 [Mycena belliarum]|uniref:MYND-type domain-containing protein n=1 Tax=Mycena belliarum TaxID=1033014 RepID=A0AAD6U155_9AGAR|nr:hypothetical protein B0H15DRAFT_345770 [Mycena belliae]